MKGKLSNEERGFSMIGLVIAIAVIGMLTAALLPKTLKSRFVDIQIAEQNRLKAMGEALASFVVARHQVPGAAALANANATVPAWNAAIAQYANESPQQVTVSGMNQQVIYLYPDNFVAPGVTLPYDQFDYYVLNGSFLAAAPDARVMLVSNLGQTPLATAAGALAAADFDAVWNQAGIPPALAELTESDTLKIERVNLNGLFFDVTLDASGSAAPGSFAVDGNPGVSPYAQIAANTAQTLRLIKGSKLSLFDANGALQTVHPVTDVAWFSYDGTAWSTGGIGGGNAGGGGGNAGGGGGNGAGPIFGGPAGQLNQWGPQPGCTSQGVFTITVANNSQSTYWAYTGNATGTAGTLLGQIKKNKTSVFNLDGCALYTVVPEVKNANQAAQLYVGYMNNAPVNITIP
ncbi:MAG: type II secretion system protein [Mariprofundaceae bacterium]